MLKHGRHTPGANAKAHHPGIILPIARLSGWHREVVWRFSGRHTPGAYAVSERHPIILASCPSSCPAAYAFFFLLHLSSWRHPTSGAPSVPVGVIILASSCPSHSYHPSSWHHPDRLSCKKVISQNLMFLGRAHALSSWVVGWSS